MCNLTQILLVYMSLLQVRPLRALHHPHFSTAGNSLLKQSFTYCLHWYSGGIREPACCEGLVCSCLVDCKELEAILCCKGFVRTSGGWRWWQWYCCWFFESKKDENKRECPQNPDRHPVDPEDIKTLLPEPAFQVTASRTKDGIVFAVNFGRLDFH